jgi:hypothetical protein
MAAELAHMAQATVLPAPVGPQTRVTRRSAACRNSSVTRGRFSHGTGGRGIRPFPGARLPVAVTGLVSLFRPSRTSSRPLLA